MLKWPDAKDPDERFDLQFDWSLRLEPGETIVASTFICADDTLTIEDEDIAGGITSFWVSGGTIGNAIAITNRITTSAGRVWDQTSTLRMRAN